MSSNPGPLDWRFAIVDSNGRPTPEFQRRWESLTATNKFKVVWNTSNITYAPGNNLLASIILTTGTWDVSGMTFFTAGTSTSYGVLQTGISTVNNTAQFPYLNNLISANSTDISGNTQALMAPTRRFIVSDTQTIYLIGYVQFTGTLTAGAGLCTIDARQID